MAQKKRSSSKKQTNGANLGFEEKLWAAADKLRGHVDAAEYKHVVLGLIFLKYISDAFEERHRWLLKETANPRSDYYVREEQTRYEVAEDRDEYTADNIFWVPKEARWSYLQANAKQSTIGQLIDEAMVAIAIYGQESNPTTWRLCKMNLAIRGIEGKIGAEPADTFHNDVHKDLRADFILANPPFNVSDWGGERVRDDVRWKYGAPPAGNANFAWVQHMIHYLAPNGIAGFVLANGSMSSNTSGEGDIRRAIIEADLVDCMIALPGQLFYTTPIPACLWFLTRSKQRTPLARWDERGDGGESRDRRGQTLFIDARKMGYLIDRTHRELTDEEIARVAGAYHAWRGESLAGGEDYQDVPGFCKSATLEEVAAHGYVLTPGRYVGAEEIEDDDEPFGEKMERLTAKLEEQFAESARLERAIRENFGRLGYGH